MSKVKKHSLFPHAYDEVSLVDEGAAGSAHVLITKKAAKSGKGRSMENPCTTDSNPSGAKDGKSKRSKNFEEKKHPRDSKGQMKQTSSESKAKYGKDGTTKAKLDAKCKRRKKKGSGSVSKIGVSKTAMSQWDTQTAVLTKLERKATR